MNSTENIMDAKLTDPSSRNHTDPDPITDPLWTVEDLAAYLKLQPETIRSMARRGELPALKIGKVWRFQKQAISEMFGITDWFILWLMMTTRYETRHF